MLGLRYFAMQCNSAEYKKMDQDLGAYSQHFVLFVTQELAQEVRVFVTDKPF